MIQEHFQVLHDIAFPQVSTPWDASKPRPAPRKSLRYRHVLDLVVGGMGTAFDAATQTFRACPGKHKCLSTDKGIPIRLHGNVSYVDIDRWQCLIMNQTQLHCSDMRTPRTDRVALTYLFLFLWVLKSCPRHRVVPNLV
jgi:hypothetical protein